MSALQPTSSSGLNAKLSALVEPRYGIFQLKDGEKLRDYRFESADRLKKNGLYIDRENYDRVYRGRLKEGETLDDIYKRFNVDHPEDFRGHSLSVSDIICVKSNGTTAAYRLCRQLRIYQSTRFHALT